MRQDQEGLETHEQRRKTEDAKRIRGTVHDNNKNKRLSRVQNETVNLMHHDEQELLSVWEGWHWDDNKGGWLDPELCSRARREEVECIRRHKMCTRVSRETCLRETGRAPIKTGWAETDKGQQGKPNVRARWVALYGTRDAAQNWEEEPTSQADARGRMPVRVDRAHQGRARQGDRARRRHHDRGERSAVELLIRKIWRKYEIKKQVIGEDADLEKCGRILNRVIEWGSDGITIEADHRHVREILKGLELERANHTAAPCAVESKNEGNARSDGRKGENRRGRRQARTKHVARISYLSQDRPDLKFASMQVCCAMARPSVRDMKRVKRIGGCLAGKPRAKCWFRWQQSGELDAHSDADWGGATRPHGDRCWLGSS